MSRWWTGRGNVIVYYALGGGLGHLTCARAVLYSLACESSAVILSSSPFVASLGVAEGIRIQNVPAALAYDRQAYRLWLVRWLAELQPAALYLDAFPAGIIGEFCDFPEIHHMPIHYVARRLRWQAYRPQLYGKLPTFHTTFCLEPLEAAHQEFIDACSRCIASLALVDPPGRLAPSEHAMVTRVAALTEGFWLLVHAGKAEEVHDLVTYAAELRHYAGSRAPLVVAAPTLHLSHLPPYAQSLGLFPAWALLPLAERVVSGCGFNIMRQMLPFRHKHCYLPFPRRFDDQYWRAAYWRQQHNGEERLQAARREPGWHPRHPC